MIKIAICDDEELYLDMLVVQLEKSKDFYKKFELFKYYDGNELLKDNEKQHFDCVFLDIEMKTISGIEIAENIRKVNEDMMIVFLTSHEEKVYEVIKLNPFRYIRKNISECNQEIDEAVEEIIKKYEQKSYKMCFQSNNKKEIVVGINEIFYFQAYDHCVTMCYENNTDVIKDTLNNIEKELYLKGFFRVHKSFIINLRKVKGFNGLEVELVNGDKVLISRHKLADFKSTFHDFIKENV